MKPEIKIQINEPCHENWSDMTDADKGRFCGVCNKVVVDFTKFSDAELFNYFSARKENPSEKLCGRFAAEKVIVPKKIEVPEFSYYQMTNGIQRFLWLLLVSLGFVMVSCSNEPVKGKVIKQDTSVLDTITEKSKIRKDDKDDIQKMKTVGLPKIYIEGEVSEVLGEPEMTVMGGIEPQVLMGDTVIVEVPKNDFQTIKGKIAWPKMNKDSMEIKKGD